MIDGERSEPTLITLLFLLLTIFMDTEQAIATDGTPVPIKSTTLSNFFDTSAEKSTTLSNFFDDIVMTSNNGKEKIECF